MNSRWICLRAALMSLPPTLKSLDGLADVGLAIGFVDDGVDDEHCYFVSASTAALAAAEAMPCTRTSSALFLAASAAAILASAAALSAAFLSAAALAAAWSA